VKEEKKYFTTMRGHKLSMGTGPWKRKWNVWCVPSALPNRARLQKEVSRVLPSYSLSSFWFLTLIRVTSFAIRARQVIYFLLFEGLSVMICRNDDVFEQCLKETRSVVQPVFIFSYYFVSFCGTRSSGASREINC
jgi:hypothetical protein